MTERHKLMRYIWCRNNINTDFSHHLFVDETTVKVMEIPLYHIRKRSSEPEGVASTAKIRYKLNVWGGISCRGPSDFVVFTENMDAEMYDQIIKKCIFPFSARKYHYNCYLHQDNDAKHTSKLCSRTIKQLKIKWIKSPPLSPDLNPIELVWSDMKRFIRKRFCSSVAELKQAVKDFRHEIMTPEYCAKYIFRMKKVIEIVIKKKGAWSNC